MAAVLVLVELTPWNGVLEKLIVHSADLELTIYV
jgi:hypothetical protein